MPLRTIGVSHVKKTIALSVGFPFSVMMMKRRALSLDDDLGRPRSFPAQPWVPTVFPDAQMQHALIAFRPLSTYGVYATTYVLLTLTYVQSTRTRYERNTTAAREKRLA